MMMIEGDDSPHLQQQCPFSITFPRYRIDMSGGRKSNTSRQFPFFNNILRAKQSILDKSLLQNKYRNCVFQWLELIDSKSQVESNLFAFVEFWKILSNTTEISTSSSVLAFPQLSPWTATRMKELFEWYKEWLRNQQDPHKMNPSILLVHLELDIINSIPICIISQESPSNSCTTTTTIQSTTTTTTTTSFDEKRIQKRMKSWVRRVLVELQICPFTKSDTKSGHGLAEFGVPVANIAYPFSNASKNNLPLLFYHVWLSIFQMVRLGPTKVSSILLAAPAFDDDFPLWSGPMFAMLETSVAAIMEAQAEIGVVCFHPHYKIPNEQSGFPGFGQMHSITKLQSFVVVQDSTKTLTRNDIAAGGAWQRRTPHATINVLRADQLQQAEGRRNTGLLYARNIRVLTDLGSEKLQTDLHYEQNLV